MSCDNQYPIFRGRRVTFVPRNCDACYVLCTTDCKLFQKRACINHGKKCSKCEVTWSEVEINQAYYFIDVFNDTMTKVRPRTTNPTISSTSGFTSSEGPVCNIVDDITGLQNPDINNGVSQINVCTAGLISNCATTKFLVSLPPAGLTGSDDTPTQCVNDPQTSTDNVNSMVFYTQMGAFRAGSFNSNDLGGQNIPFNDSAPTAAFGTNTVASGDNSFAIGIGSYAYLPGSFAQSSCASIELIRQAPPNQPVTPTLGSCQFIQFQLKGITRCLTGEQLCNANDSLCSSAAVTNCQSSNMPSCLPAHGSTGAPFDCDSQADKDELYAVTDFVICDTGVPDTADATTDLTDFCPYLPYVGTAFGTIDIVAPRIVTCGAQTVSCNEAEINKGKCVGCSLGQRWCFGVDLTQADQEIIHTVTNLEESCGNNSLTGDHDHGRYTLCIAPTSCNDNGFVRMCFRLIRNWPISQTVSLAPRYCATVAMSMIASGACDPICVPGLAETPKCFICCPIPIDGPACGPVCTPTVNWDCPSVCPSGTSDPSPSSPGSSLTSSSTRSTSTSSSLTGARRGVQYTRTTPKTGYSMPKTDAVRSANSSGFAQARSQVTARSVAPGVKKPCTTCGGKRKVE